MGRLKISQFTSCPRPPKPNAASSHSAQRKRDHLELLSSKPARITHILRRFLPNFRVFRSLGRSLRRHVFRKRCRSHCYSGLLQKIPATHLQLPCHCKHPFQHAPVLSPNAKSKGYVRVLCDRSFELYSPSPTGTEEHTRHLTRSPDVAPSTASSPVAIRNTRRRRCSPK